MTLASLAFVLGLLVSAPVAVEPIAPAQQSVQDGELDAQELEGQVAKGVQDLEHAVEEIEREAAITAPTIFSGLFSHLTPHAVTAFWIGGEHGFGKISPYKLGADGAPILDAHGHGVPYGESSKLTEARVDEYGGGFGVLIYNINTVQWIAGILLILAMVATARKAKKLGSGPPRGSVYGVVESIILFVRDEMVYAVMGKENGRKLAPIFLTQFFFILFLNVFGLVPDPLHTGLLGTATANLAVTGALALTSFLVIHLVGMAHFGPFKHLANFVPHVPGFLVPLMIVVEGMGVLIKPAALTIRLFANLTAGHLVMLGLFGLIQLAGAFLSTGVATGVAAPVILLSIAISCLELFVAFVQAYIFTYLTIVFVGASLHPEH